MIIVYTTKEKNSHTGRTEIIVSHGISTNTNKLVILPSEPIHTFGAKFDAHIGEYVLHEENK
jgi:hypothetical protein